MNEPLNPKNPVLLVDDEEQFLLSAGFSLNSNGFSNIIECSNSLQVMDILSKTAVSVIILDVMMPYLSGEDLLQMITQEYPNIPVIIITALNEIDLAVKCIKNFAFDYLVKPVDDSRLTTTVQKAINYFQMKTENELLKKSLLNDKLKHPEYFEEIITCSPKMYSIFKYIEAIGPTDLPILITGETGSGKELIAGAIHKLSNRTGEFVSVNIAGVDDTLFTDSLFGHNRGSFTNAITGRKGLIESAQDGTFFGDEIGDLVMESQVKLLRLIQEGQYYPIGSDVPKSSNARIILATNVDLRKQIENKIFRKDLFYRLQSHHIHIPPLRERKEDIPLLVMHFLKKAAKRLGKKTPTVPKELFTILKVYDFPGNIRELEGLITDAVSLHDGGILSIGSIRRKLKISTGQNLAFDTSSQIADEQIIFPERLPTLKCVETALIDEALKRADGNQSIAAEILGLSRRALNNRLQRSK